MQQIIAGVDTDSFSVLSGDDALALPMYSVGGHGVISVAANVVPAQMKSIYTAFRAGDVEKAATVQKRLFPLFGALFCESNPVPCKAALAMMENMTDVVRAPLGPLQPASVERVRAAMHGLGLV